MWSLSGKVDGLLVAEEIMPASRLRTLATRIPVVVIAGRPGERGLDTVSVDNTAGIRALAAHLTGGHGYRRLASWRARPTRPTRRSGWPLSGRAWPGSAAVTWARC